MRTFPNAKPWTERKFGECAYPIPAKNWLWSCCDLVVPKSQYCKGCWKYMYQARPKASVTPAHKPK